jgi:aspartate kinase
LGRGGSDLTATFVGAALQVKEVVVWKDVDGVLTSDPRIVRDARVVDELTFDEATELAYFGAQVHADFSRQPSHALILRIHAHVACQSFQDILSILIQNFTVTSVQCVAKVLV